MLPTNEPRAPQEGSTPLASPASEAVRPGLPTGSGESVVWDSARPSARDRSDAPAANAPVTKRCPHCDREYETELKFCPQDGAVLRSSAGDDDLIGRVIAGRYNIVRELGAGGMGRVYLATHVRLGRRCALKVLRKGLLDDVDAIARFDREAANASRITHPHVATVYDFGDAGDGIVYLAMELVDGAPLSELLRREPALPPRRACSIVTQIADGLAAAHQLGIVHRDLKPDNVMLGTNRDGSDCVKIVDFGIAKGLANESQKITATGLIIGTPAYMSPEQLAGDKVDLRSDVYSLGLIAFQLLTGALPFPSGQDALLARLAMPPRTLAEARGDVAWPAALQEVLSRTLAIAPGNRYGTVEEFSRDFRRAIDAWQPETANDGVAVRRAPSPPPNAAGASLSRRMRPLVTLGVAALVMLVFGWRYLASEAPRDKVALAEAPSPAATPGQLSTPHRVQESVAGSVAGSVGRVTKPVVKHAATPPAEATHDSLRRSLDNLRRLTDPLTGTDASARSALEEIPVLLPAMRVGADSVEAQYYAIQAYLLLGEPAAACQTLRRIEPRAASHPYLANAIKAIRADSAFECP